MNQQAQAAYDFSGDAAKVILDVLLAALPLALLYSLVLLIVSAVLIAVMHRRRLYSREKKFWNLLTKLHYPLWMLIFAMLGFALGMIASMQSSADRAVDEKLKPALAGMVSPLQQMVIESLPPEFAEGPMTGEAIYDYVVEKAAADSLMGDAAEDGFFQQIGRRIEHGVRLHLAKALIDQAVVRAGAKVGLNEDQSEFSLEVFKQMDFEEEADEVAGRVTDMVKVQVGGFANGLRLQCLLYGGILLLLLLIEPLVYYKLVLPRKKKVLAAEGSPPVLED